MKDTASTKSPDAGSMFKNGCRRCCYVMVDYLDAIGAGLILLDPTPSGSITSLRSSWPATTSSALWRVAFRALDTPAARDARSSPGRSGAEKRASSDAFATTWPSI